MPTYRKLLFENYEQATGDPDRDALICAIRAIERREQHRGWDLPPRLMALMLPRADDQTVHIDTVPLRLWAGTGPNPAGWLVQAARRHPASTPDRSREPVRFADSPRGFAALAVMTEGWAGNLDNLTPEELARISAGERVATGHSVRVETRFITAVDINGHFYSLVRYRGQEPKLITDEDEDAEVNGRVIAAMRQLTAAAQAGTFHFTNGA